MRFTFIFFVFHLSCFASLKVGMELSYPPFETVGAKGEPTGVSVDFAYGLGKSMEEPIVICNIPFAGLIPSLKTGKIDLIISSLTRTPEREKAIAFSNPYLETGLCLLINQAVQESTIEKLDQKGYKIAVKTGTTGAVYAKQNIHHAEVVVLDQESACVMEVVQHKVDAFIYDQFSIYAQWQKHKDTTKANLLPFQKEYWAIGMRKEDTILCNRINTFLIEFRKEGGFQRLADRHLLSEQKAFADMHIPFVFSLGASCD